MGGEREQERGRVMSFRWLPFDFVGVFVCAGDSFWLATTYAFRDAVFRLFAD